MLYTSKCCLRLSAIYARQTSAVYIEWFISIQLAQMFENVNIYIESTSIKHMYSKRSFGIFVWRSNLRNLENCDVLLIAYYGLIYTHLAYAVPIKG